MSEAEEHPKQEVIIGKFEEMPQVSNPMQLVNIALTKGADVETLERLMAMQERWEAKEAKKEFVTAMSAFKANPPDIIKNKQVEFLDVKYKHAGLDQVAGVIGKEMAPHGLSFRWNVEQNDLIRVTCIVTHTGGHSESVTLQAPIDQSGKKNSIQGVGSTVSYLERYTLLAITGLATQDQDDDGQGFQYNEQEEEILRLLREASLEGGDALTKCFAELNKDYPKGEERKLLAAVWNRESRSLKAAAQLADKQAEKKGHHHG